MLNYRHNLFLVVRTLFGTLGRTDWQLAYVRGGLAGVLMAFLRGLAGTNAWPFFVRAGREWPPARISGLLRARGVATWGWGYDGGEFFFRVRKRQAHRAQFVLLEHGVPLTGRLLDETHDSIWISSRRRVGFHRAGRAPETFAEGPVDAVNRAVDKLAGL